MRPELLADKILHRGLPGSIQLVFGDAIEGADHDQEHRVRIPRSDVVSCGGSVGPFHLSLTAGNVLTTRVGDLDVLGLSAFEGPGDVLLERRTRFGGRGHSWIVSSPASDQHKQCDHGHLDSAPYWI